MRRQSTNPNSHDVRFPEGLERVPIESLKLDPKNARVHKPAQIRQIAKSIKAFGFNGPVMVDKSGVVVAGHGRVMALQKLGAAEVPVIRLEHLTPAQARAYAIADNRLSETSQWDERLLAEHLKALADLDLDFDIEATGFSVGEIDLKIESLDILSPSDAAAEPALPALGPAVTKPGDLWVLGRHRLKCGDAKDPLAYEHLMGGALAALVITDPPYNVAINGHVSRAADEAGPRHREFAMASGELTEGEFLALLRDWAEMMSRFSEPGALTYVFMDWRHAETMIAAGLSVFDEMLNICVWAKSSAGMGSLYRSAHEFVFIFKKAGKSHRNNVQLGRFGRDRTNVWNYAGAAVMRQAEDAEFTRHHPTPKPVVMIADAILDVTARGDFVLDPFGGSGSTLIAAERVGRAARVMELDPQYVDLIIRRWQRLTGDDAVLEATGEGFNAVSKKGK